MATFEPRVRRQIAGRLEELGGNPRPHDSSRLKGFANAYRVDIGEYRILYDIDYDAKLITVWKIGHRKDVYRNL